jgi:hypothetical protein
MTLEQLHRIKRWHLEHQRDHPVEYHLWDAMLMLWVAGWVGWLPAFAFGAWWAAPVLAVAMSAPTLYVTWRLKAHRARRLRCDWLQVR